MKSTVCGLLIVLSIVIADRTDAHPGERAVRSGDQPGDRDIYVTQLGRMGADGKNQLADGS
ncbi:MAG: hypothetical protein IIA07_10225 [Proteobacteria bacterium]|nr:hypothetical protein [Pseudomonadota bacterium]